MSSQFVHLTVVALNVSSSLVKEVTDFSADSYPNSLSAILQPTQAGAMVQA